MGGNNKKKSSPETQCDGYSRCIKMHFLSIDNGMPEQNAFRERGWRWKFVQSKEEIDYLSVA